MGSRGGALSEKSVNIFVSICYDFSVGLDRRMLEMKSDFAISRVKTRFYLE